MSSEYTSAVSLPLTRTSAQFNASVMSSPRRQLHWIWNHWETQLWFVYEDTSREKGSPTSDVGGTILRTGIFNRKKKEEESERSTNIHRFFASGPDPA